jgi:hypothetical protein
LGLVAVSSLCCKPSYFNFATKPFNVTRNAKRPRSNHPIETAIYVTRNGKRPRYNYPIETAIHSQSKRVHVFTYHRVVLPIAPPCPQKGPLPPGAPKAPPPPPPSGLNPNTAGPLAQQLPIALLPKGDARSASDDFWAHILYFCMGAKTRPNKCMMSKQVALLRFKAAQI